MSRKSHCELPAGNVSRAEDATKFQVGVWDSMKEPFSGDIQKELQAVEGSLTDSGTSVLTVDSRCHTQGPVSASNLPSNGHEVSRGS